ncbi:MAG: flagellar basal body protein FliL [Ignavibacteria bacterium]
MADETPEQTSPAPEEQKGRALKKIVLIGVPAFFMQLVLVYFLTAKFLVPVALQNTGAMIVTPVAQAHCEHTESPAAEKKGDVREEYIYVIKDLIINPAGTNGQRYLLTTIGFNVSSEEARKELEKKELAVRDALNSILTSKTMDDLIDVSKRELLRQEIFTRCRELVKIGKLQSVYFSKYIIQ